MNSRWMPAVAALAVALAALPGAAAAEDPADAAFEAGDSDRALALYDARLAANPDDVGALVRSGMLLSWQKDYDAALERYARALEIEPGQARASLERAKVLSWAGRQDEAAEAFRAYLADHPDDGEARLGLARSLGWAGRYGEAHDAFLELHRARPRDVEPLVELGRVTSWSGRLGEAEAWYRRALEVDPSNRDAAVGLAYVRLWAGDARGAARQARTLERAYPDDSDVGVLAERAREAEGPRVRVEGEAIDDTDDNELRIARAGAGFGLGPRVGLDVEASHWDLSSPGADASIDALDADLGFRVSLGTDLHAFVGVDRTDPPSGDAATDLVGGARGTYGLDRRWQVTGSAARRALRYSPAIAAARVLYDEASAGVRARVSRRWRVAADAATADFNDGNRRRQAVARATWTWLDDVPAVEVGYSFRWLDFADDLDHGYFDPQGFTAHLAELNASGRFGGSRVRWGAELSAGVQSFTLGGVDVSNDSVLIVAGSAVVPLGRGFDLSLRAGWGDYAALTAAGYRSREITVGLRWSGGR